MTSISFHSEFKSPMRVIAFGSGSGSNIEALIQEQKVTNLFKVVALFTDRKKSQIQEIGRIHQIPVIEVDYKSFLEGRPTENHTSIQTTYFSLIAREVKKSIFKADLIVLAGFMRILPNTFIEEMPPIINVHPSDLRILNEQGKRKYIGTHAVEKALKAGELFTRSSVHIATAGVDEGPLLVVGPSVGFDGDIDSKESIKIHQNKQKKLSDHPALITAVKLIAEKEFFKKPIIM